MSQKNYFMLPPNVSQKIQHKKIENCEIIRNDSFFAMVREYSRFSRYNIHFILRLSFKKKKKLKFFARFKGCNKFKQLQKMNR